MCCKIHSRGIMRLVVPTLMAPLLFYYWGRKEGKHLAGLLETLVPLELKEAQKEELQGDQGQRREAVVLGACLIPLGLHAQELLRMQHTK